MTDTNAIFMPYVFHNMYLNTELAIPRDEDWPDFAKVTKSLRDKDWLTIGRSHNNTILDTRM